MELALAIGSAVLSIASLAVALLRKQQSRMAELRAIAEDAVAVARANASDGIPLRRTALEAAILQDLRDGKRDFSREQLWAAVEAAISRAGLK